MEREIKFRGKRPNSGKWIYGYLIQVGIFTYILHEDHFIAPECSCEVLPETVGQFTGLKDKNGTGKDIYEGDIYKTNEGTKAFVKWEEDEACWNVSKSYIEYRNIEVIGNIYDNSEILNHQP